MQGRCSSCGGGGTTDRTSGICLHCLLKREEASLSTPLPPGSRFAAFEVLERVGQGGMGIVYKALQKELGRTVALKVLPTTLAAELDFVERFRREAMALARLNHPNIVSLHEFGVYDDIPYLVMEYVEGTPLRTLLSNRRITPSLALDVVPQICDALQYAHRHGVIHRDIKPENILLDREGRVKIADFGLAKVACENSTRITGADDWMGTPHYMAPEQVENPRDVDHRADIYSLGVVFYEMLTGELPIGRFKPPSQKAPVDARLDPVVLKSLEKERELRFQSAEEVKKEMDHLESLPPSATTSSADVGSPHLHPGAGRFLAIGSFILSLIIAAGYFVVAGWEFGVEKYPVPHVREWLVSLGLTLTFASLSAGFLAITLMIRHKDPSGSRFATMGVVLAGFLMHIPLNGLAKAIALAALPPLFLVYGAGHCLARRGRSPRSLQGDVAVMLLSVGFLSLVAAFLCAKYAYVLEPMGKSLEFVAWGFFGAAAILALSEGIRSFRSGGRILGNGMAVTVLVLSCLLALPLSILVALRGRVTRAVRFQVIESNLAGNGPGSSAPFHLDEVWPLDQSLPGGLRYENYYQGLPAAQAASIPVEAMTDLAQVRYATVKPGNVTLIGIEFTDERAKRRWLKEDALIQLGYWNDRLDGGASAMVVGYDNTPWGTLAMEKVWSAVRQKVKPAR